MFLVDLFFPRFCFGCGFVGSYLCLNCQAKLVFSTDTCLYCQRKSYFGLTHPQCQKKWGVDGFVSLYKYNDTFKRILKKIKYKLVKNSTREIFPLLFEKAVGPIGFYKRAYGDIVLQPVPLHPAREKQRGFNQSLAISQHLSLFFKMKTISLVNRTLNTNPQAELSFPKERINNIKGAFMFNLRNTTLPNAVFIVDDVVTTGSTVKELARTLKKNKISRVFVFSLAKG